MHVFWGMKKLVQLKFVQLLLLNRVKARWSKNRAAQDFYYINWFSSNIFGPYWKMCNFKVPTACGCVSRGLTVLQFVRVFLKHTLVENVLIIFTLLWGSPACTSAAQKRPIENIIMKLGTFWNSRSPMSISIMYVHIKPLPANWQFLSNDS